MRILAINRHLWPDSTPYAAMLPRIAEALAADGHEVEIWAEMPCYRPADDAATAPAGETRGGVRIRRLRRLALPRHLRALLFVVRAVLLALGIRMRGARFDVVWTATAPAVLSGLGARAAARILGARLVYHVQDIHPEAEVAAGLWRAGPRAALARALDAGTCRAAHLCIVPSPDMAGTLRARGARVRVLPNFAIGRGAPRAPEGPVEIVFAGNVGRYQGLAALIEAARRAPHGLRVRILGDGASLPDLRKRARGLDRVLFEPHRPFEEAREIIARADFGFVSLAPGVHRAAAPSKAVTYLSLGVPLLVCMEGALADTVRRERIGHAAPPGDVAALTALMTRVRRDPAMRARALAYHDRALSDRSVLRGWCDLMRAIGADRASGPRRATPRPARAPPAA